MFGPQTKLTTIKDNNVLLYKYTMLTAPSLALWVDKRSSNVTQTYTFMKCTASSLILMPVHNSHEQKVTKKKKGRKKEREYWISRWFNVTV